MAGKAKVAKEESMDKKLRIPIINDVAAYAKLVEYELHKADNIHLKARGDGRSFPQRT